MHTCRQAGRRTYTCTCTMPGPLLWLPSCSTHFASHIRRRRTPRLTTVQVFTRLLQCSPSLGFKLLTTASVLMGSLSALMAWLIHLNPTVVMPVLAAALGALWLGALCRPISASISAAPSSFFRSHRLPLLVLPCSWSRHSKRTRLAELTDLPSPERGGAFPAVGSVA